MQDNQEVILQDLHRKRDAVSGVSLDEELTNLVEAEHAYQAAARLVKTMDSCLNTIVNELGFVGH
jgi:flagellar hook-associated protein 1 FlgK